MKLLAIAILVGLQALVMISAARYPVGKRYDLLKIVGCICAAFWAGVATGSLL